MGSAEMSRILVPLDGSPAAERAIPFAQAMLAPGDEIVLLRVIPEPDPVLTELLWAIDSPQDEAEAATARDDLKRVKSQRIDPDVQSTIEVTVGDPAEQILHVIDQMDIRSVVMTTHGRGAIDRVIFGSVADRIARTSPVPVLLVRPELTETGPATAVLHRLVVPLDGSPWAEAALPRTMELAQQLMIPVHLVKVINSAMVLASLSGGGMFPVAPPQDIYEQLIMDLEGTASAYLNSVATRLQERGIKATWAVLDGSPYTEIANTLQAGDLLVMTSHGRGGVMRWLLGSVAEKLVREAPAPVLLVPSELRGVHDAGSGA